MPVHPAEKPAVSILRILIAPILAVAAIGAAEETVYAGPYEADTGTEQLKIILSGETEGDKRIANFWCTYAGSEYEYPGWITAPGEDGAFKGYCHLPDNHPAHYGIMGTIENSTLTAYFGAIEDEGSVDEMGEEGEFTLEKQEAGAENEEAAEE